jgi:hypothetical protein
MSGFVIEYHRKSRDWRVTEFDGPQGYREALQRRLELEPLRATSEWEIVSLNSDSLATIRSTHARYFEGQELQSV